MKTKSTKKIWMKRKRTSKRSNAPDVPIPELWQLVVECQDEDQQRALYERLTQEGYACRVLTL